MSVHFASANHPVRRLGWRAAQRGLVAPALARAANDNRASDAAAEPVQFDRLLAEALRHFAVHGLAAAQAAMDEANQARARGDTSAQDHWLAMTRMFDRRLAARMDQTQASA